MRDRKAKYNHSFAHNFTAVHLTTLQTKRFGLTLVITMSDKSECAIFVKNCTQFGDLYLFLYNIMRNCTLQILHKYTKISTFKTPTVIFHKIWHTFWYQTRRRQTTKMKIATCITCWCDIINACPREYIIFE